LENTGRAAAAEFVGTFALIFFGAGSVILARNGQLDLLGVAFAHGLVIAIMVSQMAHLSDAAFNPAIHISLWATGKSSSVRTLIMIAAQLAGAIVGAYALKALVPAKFFAAGAGGAVTLNPDLAVGKGILFEAVGTFFLVWAVFATAIDKRGPFSKTAGFTIGLTITFAILTIGYWTGAALNPARWLGPALAAGQWTDWYVWIIGPIAGGVIAGFAYWAIFLRGKEQPATP
jgi:MIP family channel proteins